MRGDFDIADRFDSLNYKLSVIQVSIGVFLGRATYLFPLHEGSGDFVSERTMSLSVCWKIHRWRSFVSMLFESSESN
jgi:hypothetical protein